MHRANGLRSATVGERDGRRGFVGAGGPAVPTGAGRRTTGDSIGDIGAESTGSSAGCATVRSPTAWDHRREGLESRSVVAQGGARVRVGRDEGTGDGVSQGWCVSGRVAGTRCAAAGVHGV